MSCSESKAEPDAYGDAGAYGDEVDEDFKQSKNDEGGGPGDRGD